MDKPEHHRNIQKEFAEKLYDSSGKKITLSSVSNYETGLHLPSPQVLPAIADILKVSIDALFQVEFKVEKETATSKKKAGCTPGRAGTVAAGA